MAIWARNQKIDWSLRYRGKIRLRRPAGRYKSNALIYRRHTWSVAVYTAIAVMLAVLVSDELSYSLAVLLLFPPIGMLAISRSMAQILDQKYHAGASDKISLLFKKAIIYGIGAAVLAFLNHRFNPDAYKSADALSVALPTLAGFGIWSSGVEAHHVVRLQLRNRNGELDIEESRSRIMARINSISRRGISRRVS